MNKVKCGLVLFLVIVISAPCFGSSVTIKRKKNKWNHSLVQKTSDNTEINPDIAKSL